MTSQQPTPNATTTETIRPKERDSLIQSLRAGVVPRVGQRLIQVGRSKEIAALVEDLDRISGGGSAIRFVVGDYGSGKTFFLNLIRSIALEKKMVTLHGDLGPDRRLHASNGQARSLYSELMRNCSTRSRPDGGALASVVERFITSALAQAEQEGTTPDAIIRKRLDSLSESTNGYDFAEVVAQYWRGHDSGNEQLKSDALRWLRGEFATRTDARAALGVRTIIEDASFYDMLKIFARFVHMAGFAGLLVNLDELVNLFKLNNSQARNSNYEQILRILNDSLQASADHLGFILGATPETMLDPRRGLSSYQALASRLAENSFTMTPANKELVDLSGPVIRLASLSPEDLYVLLHKLRHVYASGDESRYLVPDEALGAFIEHCAQRVGASTFRTPRNTVKEFVDLLAVLDQNENVEWHDLIERIDVKQDAGPDSNSGDAGDSDADTGDSDGDDNLTTFRL